MPVSTSNDRGFTLVELMVSLVILMVGMLGLLQSIILVSQGNARNIIRDEAVQVSDSYLGQLKAKPFANSTTSYPLQNVASKVRAGAVNYQVRMSSTPMGDNTRQMIVYVAWKFKNVSSHNEMISIRTR